MKSLIWFRRDLRVSDNPSLHHACKESSDGVVGIYFITPEQWKLHDDASCKVSFWLRNLKSLSESLSNINIPLLVVNCKTFAEVPKLISSTARKHNCSRLFFNKEYEVNEVRRDKNVCSVCVKDDIVVRQFHDRVVIPPRKITTKDGRFYSVFTPYRRVWDTKALEFSPTLPAPRKQPVVSIEPTTIPLSVKGFDFTDDRADLWPAGEAEAKKRLKKFATKINDYQTGRDIPSIAGTSFLSPYLAAGVISPRQCLAKAIEVNKGRFPGDAGATTWISELAWRDFYTHVMTGFPRVSMHQPFKEKTNRIKWRTNQDEFAAWREGKTGYPLVDAGMRQLNRTGWMHNRLRMVTAMFLTKHLLIDWRLGEKYFMERLIDGDLAANNGGWQWSASTGTDAVPYFRIFNPFSQSKRFDSEGKFIKKMCPELETLPATALHDPKKLTAEIERRQLKYFSFIVEHKTARERTLGEFKSLG